ncbi:hypothetical protein [Streptacidiphilus cavernicola]|uniref:Tetratricopeptide repeat protein n=1 Tax=Streptacidiphilus cavernicola TaxID=3342716 RepID=A0ABV6W2H2_9ACTN
MERTRRSNPNRGRLSALASAVSGVGVVLVAVREADPETRLALILVGFVASFAVGPVASLLAAVFSVLGGGRLAWLGLGVGPWCGVFLVGRTLLELRLVPVWVGFRVSAGRVGPRAPGAAIRVSALLLGLLLSGQLLWLLPVRFQLVAVVGWSLSGLSWLLSPGQESRRSVLRQLRDLTFPSASTRAEVPLRHLVGLLFMLMDGDVAQARAELELLRGDGSAALLVVGEQAVLGAECDLPGLLAAVEATQDQEWPDAPLPVARIVRVNTAAAVLRAAEAGQLPLAEALSRADQVIGQAGTADGGAHDPDLCALRAVLAGEFAQGRGFIAGSVRSRGYRLSWADQLCTLALAHAGLGESGAAEAALAKARRLTPGYPRAAVVAERIQRLHSSDAPVG